MQEPTFCMRKYDKKTFRVLEEKCINEEQHFKTFSMIKVVFADLFLRLGLDLSQEIRVPDQHFVSEGGILQTLHHPPILTLELLLTLMLLISDNTATNVITDFLTQRGKIENMIKKYYNVKNITITDTHVGYDFEDFEGGASTQVSPYLDILQQIFFHSPHAEKIRALLEHQYVQGRGLRLLPDDIVLSGGTKTGQGWSVLNDSGFFETKKARYAYVMSIPTKESYTFEYGVENPYSKQIAQYVVDTYQEMK